MLAMHLLQAALVHINTLLLQRVLAETQWSDRLSDVNRRGLTPLFWSNANCYGSLAGLDMHRHLDLEIASAGLPGGPLLAFDVGVEQQ
jgi:hypothetical protein